MKISDEQRAELSRALTDAGKAAHDLADGLEHVSASPCVVLDADTLEVIRVDEPYEHDELRAVLFGGRTAARYKTRAGTDDAASSIESARRGNRASAAAKRAKVTQRRMRGTGRRAPRED